MRYNFFVIYVEIVTIGNELLLGLTQDTNSNYLCRVVSRMGGHVLRVAIVRDEIEEISTHIRAAIRRQTDLIFTCGGLGPTDDDLTLAAVAHAAGLNIMLHPAARDFVERKYQELASAGYVSDAALNEARLKMAGLPEGSRMIENPVGTAPAAILEIENSRIVSLPGVPMELKAIIEGPLQYFLQEVFGHGGYSEREMIVDCGDESVLAPILREVTAAHPDVYIKSRASHFGADVKFRILISASAVDVRQAEDKVARAYSDLARAFGRMKDEG